MLFGRDPERARIGALLEAARSSRSGALVIRGEPGIGKTALLEDARDRAADMHVLTARGVESESELPFAALHQLLRPAFDFMPQLPPAQAEALRGALGLGESAAHERFLVFAACLSLLSELAERRPVLCLVDDAHWLDAASADALRFVARRLHAEGVVILFGAREGDVRTFEAPDVPSLVLDGLDADAAATLLARRAGVEPAPSVRSMLVERTRGNALALMEVPSALTEGQLAGHEALPAALPLTGDVERVFLERVRRLPDEAQLVLLVAAADDSESAALVTQAAGRLGASARALDVAERAGLVEIHGTRLLFRHPLVRSAVYEAATSGDRRTAHRALAESLPPDDDGADRRAWHLGASALEPDDEVVQALEEAAARAEARAGFMASARALERAAELSRDGSERGRRLVGAARAASLAGADDHAVAVARQALPLVEEPLLKAEIAHVLGAAERSRGRPLDGHARLLDAARDVTSLDPHKALELLVWASTAANDGGDRAAVLEVCALAEEVVPSGDDGEDAFVVRMLTGFGAMANGGTERGAELLEQALAWGSASDDPLHVYWAAACAVWLGDDQRRTTLLSRAISLARARGAIGVLPEALGMLAHQLFLAQRFDETLATATEALEIARELRHDNFVPSPLSLLASVAAIRGHDEEARRLAHEALEIATPHGLVLRVAGAVWPLALLDLGRARWLEALEHLDALADVRPRHGSSFVAVMTAPDRVEAALRAGRPDTARSALPTFEAWAGTSGAAWAQPRLASCRALLAEGGEATAHFEEALRLGSDARPFDLARIHLLYGEHLRRERRRVDARVQLRKALDAFEGFRAEPWAERARAELRASGETARKRDPSTSAQLTPQELQIARFVAEGLSNKEVAAQLFLSPRTIDAHLRSVFAKLGITSRTQLARLPLGDPEPVAMSA